MTYIVDEVIDESLMLVGFNVALDNSGCNADSHLGHLVLDLVQGAFLFKSNLLLGSFKSA